MLLIQFSTMVIDRALYLRKTVLGKLAFQVVLVLAVHLWMFFILPAVTERCVPGFRPRPHTGFVVPGGGRVGGWAPRPLTWPPGPVQDVQPERGGPAVVLCEMHLLRFVRLPNPLRLPHPHPWQLSHQEVQPPQPLPLPGVSVASLGCWVGEGCPPSGPPDGAPASGRFRLVPFLVELRAVMDWVWTDTTLSLSNWMCVEDIYANIFIIKCSRETEKVLGPQGALGTHTHWGPTWGSPPTQHESRKHSPKILLAARKGSSQGTVTEAASEVAQPQRGWSQHWAGKAWPLGPGSLSWVMV